jgi:hypothetical protein
MNFTFHIIHVDVLSDTAFSEIVPFSSVLWKFDVDPNCVLRWMYLGYFDILLGENSFSTRRIVGLKFLQPGSHS